MNRLRLAFVSHSLPPPRRPHTNIGGMQRVAQELLEALTRRSDTVVQPLVMRSAWRWIYIRVVPFLFWTHFRLKRLLEDRSVDVVLFSSLISALPVIALAPLFRHHGVHTGVIVHGLDVTAPFAPYQGVVSLVLDRIDHVFPVSAATGDACTARGCPAAKIQVIHNGVNISRFKPIIDRYTMRHELLARFSVTHRVLPHKTFLLCSVGRLVKRKGFAWFITHVLPRLPEDVHYWVAGSGPELSAIEEATKAVGLEDRVRLLGLVSDAQLHALYRGADLFIMPNIPVENDMEGFGIVMLEAAMNGLPTVASRLEGIAEVIQEGQNGVLVEPGDADAFQEEILRYRQNMALLLTASNRARLFTRKTYSWDEIASRYVSVFAETRSTE